MYPQEAFEKDINALVSILNADNLNRETVVLANEMIIKRINAYFNPIITIPEDK